MKGSASKKFDNGKFLKVEVEFSDKIKNIVISGDFFLVPEDSLAFIENSLLGIKYKSSVMEIENLIVATLVKDNAQLVGCSTNQLAELIVEAVRNGSG